MTTVGLIEPRMSYFAQQSKTIINKDLDRDLDFDRDLDRDLDLDLDLDLDRDLDCPAHSLSCCA